MAQLSIARMHQLSAGADEPVSGDVTYRLGGQFWPSRCFAELRGDGSIFHGIMIIQYNSVEFS